MVGYRKSYTLVNINIYTPNYFYSVKGRHPGPLLLLLNGRRRDRGHQTHRCRTHCCSYLPPTIMNLHTTHLFIKLTYTHLEKEGDTTHIDY